MKKRKLAAGLAMYIAAAFFMTFFSPFVQAAAKRPITDFVPFEDFTLAPDEYEDYATAALAGEKLLLNYPIVEANDSMLLLTVVAWELAPSDTEAFERKDAGAYDFHAQLEPSDRYETEHLTIPPPSVCIQIEKQPDPLIMLRRFDTIEDAEVSPAQEEGFETLEKAQATLLKNHSSVFADGGETEVEVSAWNLVGDSVYTVEKDGEYLFTGQLAEPQRYDISQCENQPKIRLRIRTVVKQPILYFNTIEPIYKTVINPYGYRTEEEALSTLATIMRSVKVNGTEEVVGVYRWKRADTTRAYDPYSPGEVTFVAQSQFSEKYDIEHYTGSPAVVKVVFTLPKSYVSLWVSDEAGNAIRSAEITLSGDGGTYNGVTQNSGNYVLYDVEPGSYTVRLRVKKMEFSRSLTVRKGTSASVNWQVPLKESRSVAKPVVTEAKTTTTALDPNQALASDLQKAVANHSGTALELYSNLNSGGGLLVEVAPMTEEQRAHVLQMSVEDLSAEIQRVVKAVKTMNVNGTSANILQKMEAAVEGSDIQLLPIHFSAHTQFAFPVQLTVQGGVQKNLDSGDCSLYYYNPDTGLPEYAGEAWADGNGLLVFTVSHCSDYFLIKGSLQLRKDSTSTPAASAESTTRPSISVKLTEPEESAPKITVLRPTVITLENPSRGYSFSEIVLAAAFAAAGALGLAVFMRNRMK